MTANTHAVLAGSTGLVGSHILTTLASNPSISSTHAYTRRALRTSSPTLTALESSETSQWPSLFPTLSGNGLFLSALGTTRGQAGGIANQRKIDLDLNLELARAAREKGVNVYVLVSSGGANKDSLMFYPKMKGELEEAVKELGFTHTVILRPGLIVGEREDRRPAEFAVRKIAGFVGSVLGDRAKDFWAQDAGVIARAAVKAGLDCVEGRREPGVWLLGQADIVRLGRTEWVEPKAA